MAAGQEIQRTWSWADILFYCRCADPRKRLREHLWARHHRRKRAEEALSRSQKTFSELVERSPFGIYVVDSRFRIAHMNISSQNGAFRNVRPVIGRPFLRGHAHTVAR